MSAKVQRALDDLARVGVVVLNDPEVYYLRVAVVPTGWTIHSGEDDYMDSFHTKRLCEVERELEQWFKIEAQIDSL